MTDRTDQALTHEELQTLEALLVRLSGPGAHLPWPLFRFITEVAATPNVDLLVQDPAKGVLLAWRDDPFGTGWHVPGSIIRHREEVDHRIAACARDEFGCDVHTTGRPVALIQIFDDRGHSVSVCVLASLRGNTGPAGRRPGRSARARRPLLVHDTARQPLPQPFRLPGRNAGAGVRSAGQRPAAVHAACRPS